MAHTSRVFLIMRNLLALLHIFTLVAGQNDQIPMQAESGVKRPNIVFVLTDDQDSAMGSMDYMPLVKKHLTDKGTSFKRHYCTVALCCPSRVSLWTGLTAHTANVTDVNPPWGGYPKFVHRGLNRNYLPVWLQSIGYGTYYVGKLFNAQGIWNYHSPHAKGFTGSEFALDPYTYRYMNTTLQRNHDPPVSYEGQYSTDVMAEKAHGFLEDALEDLKTNDKPFFLAVAPIAPHCDINIHHPQIHGNFTEDTQKMSPPVPAERHKNLFEDAKVPRTPHFNADHHDKVSWMSKLEKQSQDNVDYNDRFHRARLQSLQAVDEMVKSLVTRLEEAGVMDNTYFLYSSDNGYHIGQHRLQPGKQCAWEEDINVPLIIRGPGVPEGEVTEIGTTHTDMSPTLLALAGVKDVEKRGFDGQAIPVTNSEILFPSKDSERDVRQSWSQEHVNVEMWGIVYPEGKFHQVLNLNHTYKALRVIGAEYDLLYTVWCSGEHELYDLKTDPYSMHNLYTKDLHEVFPYESKKESQANITASTPLPDMMATAESTMPVTDFEDMDSTPRTLLHLIQRLDSLLMVMKTCRYRECTHPWDSLHPGGEVRSLGDALHSRFDEVYVRNYELAQVSYQKCERGFIAASEQPMFEKGKAYGMVHEMAYEP